MRFNLIKTASQLTNIAIKIVRLSSRMSNQVTTDVGLWHLAPCTMRYALQIKTNNNQH